MAITTVLFFINIGFAVVGALAYVETGRPEILAVSIFNTCVAGLLLGIIISQIRNPRR